ncbi:hypothetical protein V8E51_016723 [Hyaloscypha variabilis]
MVEAGQVLLVICAIVSCFACAARFYLRVIVSKRKDLSEFALVFAVVMELAIIAMQLRIFALLPTMQNPSHFIEVQKVGFANKSNMSANYSCLGLSLLKIAERRLRLAICGVYSIAFVAIIVSIIRIVLLATDVQNSIKRIMVLTAVEMTVCIVIGVLPGISSSFTKRYAPGGSSFQNPTSSSRLKSGKLGRPTFAQLSGQDTSVAKDGGDADAMELHQLGHREVGFTEARGYSNNSLTGSTDQIIGQEKGGIMMMTHIEIARDD